ncbi:MAG: hypothetical protein EOP06_07805 [Proteobacteria bacterium]|nr:MAG: hypothetical protein EOP06_07805 [Pseudomonadota bacterium]
MNETLPPSFELEKPLALWMSSVLTFLLAATALSYVIFQRTELLDAAALAQASMLAILASLIVFHQTKGAWTVSIIGWTSALGLLIFARESFYEIAPYAFVACIAFKLILLVNVILSVVYLKTPYVQARSTLLGLSTRQQFSMPTLLQFDEQTFPEQSITISPTGLRMTYTAGAEIKLGQKVWVQIPSISQFKSEAVIVDVQVGFVSVELLGWTWSSLVEHLKLRRWLNNASIISSQAGYTLTEVLFVAGLASLVILGSSQLVVSMKTLETRSKVGYSIEALKYEIFTAILDTNAWKLTVSDTANASMQCLRDKSSCDPASHPGGKLRIKNTQNLAVFDSVSPTQGFDRNGTICNSGI